MDKNTLIDFAIPQELVRTLSRGDSHESLTDWENDLLSFFSVNYKLFTPYPDYFRLRTYEFRVLRQLLPMYFDRARQYEMALEIGCNFGYKSILLSPYAKQLLAVDIPATYDGCELGEFKRTTEVAKILVNEKMGISHVEFKNMWPNDLKIGNESVDFIFTEYVLEHIPDLKGAIREMGRVLRKGTVMIHTVPNTHDAIRAYLDANINITLGRLLRIAKSQLGAFLKRQKKNKPTLRWNATIVPPCHSDHIHNFSKQLDIYTLENYLFPMLENGFTIERILSTREHNYVVVARKL